MAKFVIINANGFGYYGNPWASSLSVDVAAALDEVGITWIHCG